MLFLVLKTILDKLASTRKRKNTVRIVGGGGGTGRKRSVERARLRDDDIKVDLNEIE